MTFSSASLRMGLVTLMLAVAFVATAGTVPGCGWKGLTVTRADGSAFTVEIDTGLDVEIASGVMTILSKGSRYDVDLADISSITHLREFKDITTSEPSVGVDASVRLPAVRFVADGLMVTLPDSSGAGQLLIHDVAGRLLMSRTVVSGEVISRQEIPLGTLVVSVGAVSMKICHSF